MCPLLKLFSFVFLMMHAQKKKKKAKLVSGFSLSCHVFNRLSLCRGIASCLSASLYPHVCFHVRHDGKAFSHGAVWVSQINHSAVFIPFFFFCHPSDFLPFSHQSVISPRPWREPHIYFISSFCLRETHQEPLSFNEKYILHFSLNASNMSYYYPCTRGSGLLWLMLITYTLKSLSFGTCTGWLYCY